MATPLRILDSSAAADVLPGGTAPKRVFLETFGCQMNILDSELVRDQLLTLGYSFVKSDVDADIVLYNTCAVRAQSEHKVLSRLGIMQRQKKIRPDLVVGLLGCMAERVGGELSQKLKHLDLVVGPSELDRLPALLEQISHQRAEGRSDRHVAVSGHTSRRARTLDAAMDRLEALDQGRLVDENAAHTQAYVRITRGCNKFCSFCVGPPPPAPPAGHSSSPSADRCAPARSWCAWCRSRADPKCTDPPTPSSTK